MTTDDEDLERADGAVRNEVSAEAVGHVVQAHTIAGDIHLHMAQQHQSGPTLLPIAQLTNPFDLEVHPAIDVEADTTDLAMLPHYIERAHDATLAAITQRAVDGHSGVAVLVGSSSTGKTRACWEAVQALPNDWLLWHPINPGRPEAALAEIAHIGPRTVIWLNEAHHYLLTPSDPLGERVAAGFRALLRDPSRSPILVLGTVWPEYWATLTQSATPASDDAHAQARALLTGAGIIVPDTFSGIDLDALRDQADRDPRLTQALLRARDGQVTQYLAGIPALIERYLSAPTGARAVIEAAMDASRLDHIGHIPHSFLEGATPGYLTDQQWHEVGENWLEDALAYTGAPCRGTLGLLTRYRPRPGQNLLEPCYRLADYLAQEARDTRILIAPPETFWNAAQSCNTVENLMAIADSARVRWRYRHATLLYRKAADAGNARASLELARLQEEFGNQDEARALYRKAACAGDVRALRNLARMATDAEDTDSAKQFYEQAAANDDAESIYRLALIEEHAGNQAAAELLYQRASLSYGIVRTKALRQLARLRAAAGDEVAVEKLHHEAAKGVQTVRRRSLTDIQKRMGGPEATERYFLKNFIDTVETGQSANYSDLEILAEIYEEKGDDVEAERFACRAAALGNASALLTLAQMRHDAGKEEDAELLARQAADAGELWGLRELARSRSENPKWAQMLRYGLEADGTASAPWT